MTLYARCLNCAHAVDAPNAKKLCCAPVELRPLWAEQPSLYTPLKFSGNEGYLVLPGEGADCKAWELKTEAA